jgi:hypothetical protein
MQVQKLELDRARARELYQAYKKHVHWSTPIDDEVRRAYQLIGQGRMVIKAIESIKLAGLKLDTFPKLALCRADATCCVAQMEQSGGCSFIANRASNWRHHPPRRSIVTMPGGSFRTRGSNEPWRATALLPTPPLNLRPKRGLANYHVLWEAEWAKVVPHDPMLLRRIGRADLWLVLASWDLTEVERAALSTRIT